MNTPRKMRIFISSAGRRVELMGCFRESAAALGIELEILAGDLQPEISPACHMADRAFAMPECMDETYVDELLKICREEGVGMVVPTIDPELETLSVSAERFSRAQVRICVPPAECVAVCRDKLLTALSLDACGVSVPRSAGLAEKDVWGAWEGPLIVKPIGGSSSVGIQRCADARQLSTLVPMQNGDCIVQELVQGPEYTVNCFFDPGGKLRCAVPHRRISVRQGEVYKGVTERIPALMQAAKLIEQMPFRFTGVICFQAILRGGIAYVFEINARFGGGYPLAHRAGAHFTRWLLEELSGIEPSYSENWSEGVKMLRYDQSVFLDSAGRVMR